MKMQMPEPESRRIEGGSEGSGKRTDIIRIRLDELCITLYPRFINLTTQSYYDVQFRADASPFQPVLSLIIVPYISTAFVYQTSINVSLKE